MKGTAPADCNIIPSAGQSSAIRAPGETGAPIRNSLRITHNYQLHADAHEKGAGRLLEKFQRPPYKRGRQTWHTNLGG
jgi:hypothetical protein